MRRMLMTHCTFFISHTFSYNNFQYFLLTVVPCGGSCSSHKDCAKNLRCPECRQLNSSTRKMVCSSKIDGNLSLELSQKYRSFNVIACNFSVGPCNIPCRSDRDCNQSSQCPRCAWNPFTKRRVCTKSKSEKFFF